MVEWKSDLKKTSPQWPGLVISMYELIEICGLFIQNGSSLWGKCVHHVYPIPFSRGYVPDINSPPLCLLWIRMLDHVHSWYPCVFLGDSYDPSFDGRCDHRYQPRVTPGGPTNFFSCHRNALAEHPSTMLSKSSQCSLQTGRYLLDLVDSFPTDVISFIRSDWCESNLRKVLKNINLRRHPMWWTTKVYNGDTR